MQKRMTEKLVRDVMSRDVYTAHVEHTWSDAARKMSAKNIHHLVVVDDQHAPVRVVSSFDFLVAGALGNETILGRRIGDHEAARKLLTVKEDDTLAVAAGVMNDHHVESVVVLNDAGKLSGVLAAKDIMNAMFDA